MVSSPLKSLLIIDTPTLREVIYGIYVMGSSEVGQSQGPRPRPRHNGLGSDSGTLTPHSPPSVRVFPRATGNFRE